MAQAQWNDLTKQENQLEKGASSQHKNHREGKTCTAPHLSRPTDRNEAKKNGNSKGNSTMTCLVFPFFFFLLFVDAYRRLLHGTGRKTSNWPKFKNAKTACRLILSLGRELTCPRPSGASDTHVHQIRQSHVWWSVIQNANKHICQYAHAIPERDFLRFPKGKIPNISQRIHESGLPFIPERECSKLFREVGAQVFWETGSMTSGMINLTPPEANDLPGTAEKVDPLRLKGFTKANCPIFPKGNVGNLLGRSMTGYGREIPPYP